MADLVVERVDVWAASIPDEPGGLARVLRGLREAGVDLSFVIARRAPEKPGTGAVFLTPLKGDREVRAATALGFNVTTSIQSLRVEGDNRAGVVAEITEKLAGVGINLHGLSAAKLGSRFILYLSFDSAADAVKAMEVLGEGV